MCRLPVGYSPSESEYSSSATRSVRWWARARRVNCAYVLRSSMLTGSQRGTKVRLQRAAPTRRRVHPRPSENTGNKPRRRQSRQSLIAPNVPNRLYQDLLRKQLSCLLFVPASENQEISGRAQAEKPPLPPRSPSTPHLVLTRN